LHLSRAFSGDFRTRSDTDFQNVGAALKNMEEFKMNRKILKSFVCCGTLVFTISSCATVKNFAGFFDILKTSKEQAMGKNISIFARTIRPARGNPDSHYLLARYYQDRGNHWEAIIEFEKTLAIDPGNVKALNAMGVSYDCLKDFELASRSYQAALKLSPNSAYIYNNMGQSLVLQEKYIQAIEAFKKALAYDKDFPDVRIHNNLGRVYAMAGQYDLALAEFEQGSKGVSAKSVLDRVLREAEGQPPEPDTLAIAAGDEVKVFSGKVAKFLQERSADNVRHEIATAAPAPQKQPAMDVADSICIEVSNGNGVRFIARDIRDYLNKKGFRVSRVTNGNKMEQTHIYYEKGHAQEAKLLAGQMPVVVEIKEMSRHDMPREIKLRLLLGKDMAQHMRGPSQESNTLSSWIGA
jgi:Tfp pilus assembly protein PilF